MKRFLNEKIVPYKGTDSFKLGISLEAVRTMLKNEKIRFNQAVDPHKGCTPEIPWTLITIDDCITLCFAEDILFEIAFENQYEGVLPNGIMIGMDMNEADHRDSTLQYNEDDEDYISANGYWIEDDLATNTILSITVFLPEVENEDFFKYDCVGKYKS